MFEGWFIGIKPPIWVGLRGVEVLISSAEGL
jgi:hypothetical protein